MRILLISPGIDKRFSDIYHVYRYIAEQGHPVTVVSVRHDRLKTGGAEHSPLYERDGNLTIHRIFEDSRAMRQTVYLLRKLPEIRNIIHEFKPDIVLSDTPFATNLIWLGLFRALRLPLVTRVEFFHAKHRSPGFARGQRHLERITGGKRIYDTLCLLNWRSVCYHSAAIISCHHGDRDRHVPQVHTCYIPWPSEVPPGIHIMTDRTRKAKRIIFIGALDEHKRIKIFLKTMPLIFAHTPIEEFWVVGSGRDFPVIHALEAQYPGRIIHHPFLERDRCLALISESLFGYSPARWGAWGFIGDCWAVGTPVIVTSNHYNFNDDVDAIVAEDDMIVPRLNAIMQQPEAYRRIAENGRKRFLDDHSARGISDKFIEVCRCVLQPV